jgi:hypothetical protein
MTIGLVIVIAATVIVLTTLPRPIMTILVIPLSTCFTLGPFRCRCMIRCTPFIPCSLGLPRCCHSLAPSLVILRDLCRILRLHDVYLVQLILLHIQPPFTCSPWPVLVLVLLPLRSSLPPSCPFFPPRLSPLFPLHFCILIFRRILHCFTPSPLQLSQFQTALLFRDQVLRLLLLVHLLLSHLRLLRASSVIKLVDPIAHLLTLCLQSLRCFLALDVLLLSLSL